MKKILLLLIASLLLVACGPDESDFKSDVPTSRPAFEDRVTVSEVEAPAALPEAINLEAPFYPQAPDADWSLPWKEACEEASLVLAHYGIMGENLSKEEFKQIVLDMVDWQEEYFGYYEDTTIEETLELYQKFFPKTAGHRIVENPTIEDLKKELAAGHLIVAPFAGRMLGNPFYSGEGPYYHMMVIKGYDQTNFITNDVGTKRGLNFIYPYATIMNALHDYHPSDIQSTAKRVIVLE